MLVNGAVIDAVTTIAVIAMKAVFNFSLVNIGLGVLLLGISRTNVNTFLAST